MKALVVVAHPDPESFVGSLARDVTDTIRGGGHELRVFDLCAEGFDPVFTGFERTHHSGPPAEKLAEFPALAPHVEALAWCDTLVLVYPTWWSGQPAILKGWFDRVLMRGVAWDLPEGADTLVPLLSNIGRIVAVTTHGSGKFANMLRGEPGKRTVTRSVRLMCRRTARTTWLAFYGTDTGSAASRERFRRRVVRRISSLR